MTASVTNRREFLSFLGRDMLLAGVGGTTAHEMGLVPGLASAWADGNTRLSFGSLEPLAALLAETAPDKILRVVVPLIHQGTELRQIVAAAALANARACGGEDYVGFHTFMALAPALQMSRELPSERKPLPILKVLHRNSRCLEERGGSSAGDTLTLVAATDGVKSSAVALQDAVRGRDLKAAEQVFAGLSAGSPESAWNDLLPTVHDGLDVHRTVLAHRAWDMLTLVGPEHANTLLRQSVHYCWKNEEYAAKRFAPLRELLPKLFDQHGLAGKKRGTREADDTWLESTFRALTTLAPAEAAGLVAAALAEGFSPNAITEAIALAANELVLRDEGRPPQWAQPNKPVGSVHGDSIGVHASDAANAWRYIAAASSDRNCFASLILSAYHVAMDYHESTRSVRAWSPRPTAEVLKSVTSEDPKTLLVELDGAIREKNQELVCGVVRRYCDLGHSHRPVLDLLLGYATSEDGALHAEKYYRTTTDELARSRKQHQARQLVGLARVTASEFGTPAPGYEEACGLLKVPMRDLVGRS